MKTSKSSIAMTFSVPRNNSFLKFFLLLFFFIFSIILTGCHHHHGSAVFPEEKTDTLRLYGKVKLNNIKFPTSLCGNNDYQFRDLSVFNLSIQDDNVNVASISANGEFSFSEMEPREQVVIFCQNSSNKNIAFEWMGASSTGLSGEINVTINIYSTARSYIARTLRDRYGKRVKPEFIEDKYIQTTVDAIAEVIEKNPELLVNTPLSEVPLIKDTYTAMASSLNDGGSGAYPKEHVFLFYFAGDNDLGIFMENTINSIAKAGLPSNTEVLIAFDTSHSLPLLNKAGGAAYRLDGNKLKLLYEIGDVDSTNALAIEKFIELSVREYPAKGYSLILSSHGGGWRDHERILASNRAVFMNDVTSVATGTVLNIASGIELAFNQLNASNRKFDMIVLDACNMGCIETAYEFSNLAEYTVFSQALMPAEGIPYNDFFKEISERNINNTTAFDRAELICKLYSDKYVNQPNVIDTGISLIDNSVVPNYVSCCKNYFEAIYKNINTYAPLIYNIRTLKTTNDGEEVSGDVIQSFSAFKEFVDLKQLVKESYNVLLNVKIESDALSDAFDSMVKYSKYSDSLKNANGISITFPEKDVYNAYYNGILPANEYYHLKFLTLTDWGKILDAMMPNNK
ncbi:MAG: hypothetical protein II961_05160 [Candidatus Riflebacteria bacterium]|nr:hypothetical protein [Candidatus Riflebacteria bacterium]